MWGSRYIVRRLFSRHFTSQITLQELDGVARSVHAEVNRIFSLWSGMHAKCCTSKIFSDDAFLQLAAKHLGLRAADDLLKLSPDSKVGKLPNVMAPTRIVYQEGIGKKSSSNDNDIWLGPSRVKSMLCIGLNYRFPDAFGPMDVEECEVAGNDYCIFVYPYMRKNSSRLIEALTHHNKALDIMDMQSIIYAAGSTGSTRLLRFLSHILHENLMGGNAADSQVSASSSAIHSVEEHAWPWMKATITSDAVVNLNTIPVILDSLCAGAIVGFNFEREHAIFDNLAEFLKTLDTKARQISEATSTNEPIVSPETLVDLSDESNAECTPSFTSSDIDYIRRIDDAVLTKVVQLLILKRNFQQLNNDHIRVFSDFICDRLHRIDAKSVANIAFAVGHSKHLDEFWMFMTAKHIQTTLESFGADELTAILDAYSGACLEDAEFYLSACKRIRETFNTYSPKHLAIVLRSLGRVRVVDAELLESTMDVFRKYAAEHLHANKKVNKKECSYVIATALVSAGDLDYRGDELDKLWLILSGMIREAALDVCAMNWLPLSAITLVSRSSLFTFLPIWLRHVRYTMQKLRSKSIVMTIQRRHLLLLHAFNFGIFNRNLIPTGALAALESICKFDNMHVPEDYVPESSTFHLEVCACLRALEVAHQREINTIPFVMDIVIPARRGTCPISPIARERQRISDEARSGKQGEDSSGYKLEYTRRSANHRKKKQEVYIGNGRD
ncbi:hypothetical protein BdWA1_000550 [Babesia duncani]|uniref:Uncharacterized protein n=1 Tax=Babesia duncani TaxID=323732 RepID=A0AAD9PNE8_9APIC|nr:hypothetical protein BdWA1_000550 [Babesia duncani]